jgi:DNA repair protein RecN (Recombination protein N)
LRVKEHVHLLDRYAGLDDERRQLAERVRALRTLRAEIETLLSAERDRARRVDQLKFQIEEIHSARLKANEEDALLVERNRLANAEQLAALADEAFVALAEGVDEQPAAIDLAGQGVRALAALAKIDPKLAELHAAAASAVVALDDVAASLREYREHISTTRAVRQIKTASGCSAPAAKYGDGVADPVAARAEAELAARTQRGRVAAAHGRQRLSRLGRGVRCLSAAARQRRPGGSPTECGRGALGVQFTWAESPRGCRS